jgi:rhodanese-related sulfurtransferase
MKFKRIFLIICFLPFVSADIVIDVRTPVEWSEGHLQSSDNIEWQNILSITESVQKMRRYIFIAGVGTDLEKLQNY